MSRNVENLKKYRIDLIVIACIAALCLSVLLISLLTKREGDTAVVTIDGEVVMECPLSKDGEYTLGGGTNVLVIEDGEAYMSYSECPDHTCEKTGRIRYVGQSITCLPNRISVSIRGDAGVELVS